VRSEFIGQYLFPIWSWLGMEWNGMDGAIPFLEINLKLTANPSRFWAVMMCNFAHTQCRRSQKYRCTNMSRTDQSIAVRTAGFVEQFDSKNRSAADAVRVSEILRHIIQIFPAITDLSRISAVACGLLS
jgi:hypothetical protein